MQVPKHERKSTFSRKKKVSFDDEKGAQKSYDVINEEDLESGRSISINSADPKNRISESSNQFSGTVYEYLLR